MVDTEVSSLKLVGGDMVGAMAMVQETVLEESNMVCMVNQSM